MNANTLQWLKKADNNFRSMQSLLVLNDDSANDDICVLAQQSAEKILKALCIEHEIDFPYTHDLQKLVHLLQGQYEQLRSIEPELVALTRMGASYRYPDDFASRSEAVRSADLATKVRKVIRELLGPTEGMLFP